MKRIDLADPSYPIRIKNLMGKYTPRHLDIIGNIELLKSNAIGFSGARKASDNGLEVALHCADRIARDNITIINGNAKGVDFMAQYSGLEAGGNVILVLPEGINHYKMHNDLSSVWDHSLERILIISQFDKDDPWTVFRAMGRNRLIIALSKAMIAIDASIKGGTLNAGKESLKMKIPLFIEQSIITEGSQILLNMGANIFDKNNLSNIYDVVN